MSNDKTSIKKKQEFICTICNKSFTTKNGLKKHSTKKIPCTANNVEYKCEKCNILLSSKRNLDNHLLMHKMNELRDRAFVAESNKKNNNLTDNLIQDNVEINDNHNHLEDNLAHDIINMPQHLNITIEEYNHFNVLKNEIHDVKNKYNTLFDEFKKITEEFKKINDENKKLRDENKKLTGIINITNNDNRITNIDNSITNNIDNRITNIDNSITNNVQINIISIDNDSIDIKYILESFRDETSSLYDFLKIFNYDHLNYPKIQNGLNDYQRCKAIKIRRSIERERKKVIPPINSGFCKILGKHYLVVSYKNIKYLGKNICKVYKDQQWELITIYDAKQILFNKIINSMIDYLKLQLSTDNINVIKTAMKFITNDFYRNSKEYICCNNTEFIYLIKN